MRSWRPGALSLHSKPKKMIMEGCDVLALRRRRWQPRMQSWRLGALNHKPKAKKCTTERG